jgi:hypothetical protein
MNQTYMKVVYKSPKLSGNNLIDFSQMTVDKITAHGEVQWDLVDHVRHFDLEPLSGYLKNVDRGILSYARNRIHDLADEQLINQQEHINRLKDQYYEVGDNLWKKSAAATNYIKAVVDLYGMFDVRGNKEECHRLETMLAEQGFGVYRDDANNCYTYYIQPE